MLVPVALLALQDPDATRVIIERSWLDQASTIGQSLVSLLVLILLVTATFALLALRRALDELTRLVKSTSSDITGAVHDARLVVEELRSLTGRVRGTADVVRAGARVMRGAMSSRHAHSDEEGSERRPGSELTREERIRRKRRRRRGGDRPRPTEGGEPQAEAGDGTE